MIDSAPNHNAWFTVASGEILAFQNAEFAWQHWKNGLNKLQSARILKSRFDPCRNIPLVGFHDISVLATGNIAIIKSF
ncbi:hypothetical protein CS542_05640 [Pedobacter sp. IW39]|nr:hypothetical protein CS542_05640 [Pedobacter sp. IW39]